MQYLIGKIGINWQVLGPYCSDPAVELGGTVDSEIFDIFDKVPNSYTFDESGNFVQLISIEEAKSIILSKKYIPDINASLIEFAQLYLRTNKPKAATKDTARPATVAAAAKPAPG